VPKPDRDKIAAEIKGMQQELRDLQNALADLLDAMITEEKPGPKKIKKLVKLKKKTQNEKSTFVIENAKPGKRNSGAKRRTKKPHRTTNRQHLNQKPKMDHTRDPNNRNNVKYTPR